MYVVVSPGREKRQERKHCAIPSIEEALRLLSYFLSFFACLEAGSLSSLFLPCILLHLAFAKRSILFLLVFGFSLQLYQLLLFAKVSLKLDGLSKFRQWVCTPRENIERHSDPCSTTMGMMNCNGSEYS
jgi:hypothetical protein